MTSPVLRMLAVALFLASCSRDSSVPVRSDAGASADAGTCVHPRVEPRCHDGFCMVPAGCFVAGSPPAELRRGRYSEEMREVTLTHPFLLAQHELTQAEWVQAGFPNLAGSMVTEDGGRDCTAPSCPASTMTWVEAVAFTNWRSRAEGYEACYELVGCTGAVGVDFTCEQVKQTTPSLYECMGFRLPTVSEFQYAARAGTRTTFPSGDYPPNVRAEDAANCIAIPHLMESAWYCANSGSTTHPVMEKLPNAWGIHDLLGNAMEFTSSMPEYTTQAGVPQRDPNATLPDSMRFASVGGVSFFTQSILRPAFAGMETTLKSSRRAGSASSFGFRLARTLSSGSW